MSNITNLGCVTTVPIQVDKVLTAACGKLREVLIVGIDANGDFYIASSHSNCAELLWLAEKAKIEIMREG